MYNRKLTNIAKSLIQTELRYYELRNDPIVKEFIQISTLRDGQRKNTKNLWNKIKFLVIQCIKIWLI